MTLQELKDNYAQENGYNDWFYLELEYSGAGRDTLRRHWHSIDMVIKDIENIPRDCA